MVEAQHGSDVKPASPAAVGAGRKLPAWIGIWIRLAVVLAAGLIVVLIAARWDVWVGARVRQTTDDANVRGDITPLSAKVEGYVHSVPVTDFQQVKAGDLLIQIDDEDYQARVAQAEADLLGAEAAIDNLKSRKTLQHAQIDEAESTITATQADVERTKLEAARQRALLSTTFGTPQRVEQAVADERRFEATLGRNRAELEGQRREMAVLDTQELIDEPSFYQRGILQTMTHGERKMVMPTWPVRFDGVPTEVKSAPLLGEHTAEVLADWLGLDAEAVAGLRADGIV